MSLPIAVVYEADADFQIATEVADRVFCEMIDYIEPEVLDAYRTWIGTIAAREKLTWSNLPRLAREIGIKAHGHFDGIPAEADAIAARRAIRFLLKSFPGLNAIVLIRDQDDQPQRRTGLEQARNEHRGCPVIIGLAIPEREAWVVSGFEPQDEAERVRLDDERQKLGFHPHERSHELTAGKDDSALRSPKRVLRELCCGDFERERQCWNHTPLEMLRKRGTKNGLAMYLNEVLIPLAPLLGHVS